MSKEHPIIGLAKILYSGNNRRKKLDALIHLVNYWERTETSFLELSLSMRDSNVVRVRCCGVHHEQTSQEMFSMLFNFLQPYEYCGPDVIYFKLEDEDIEPMLCLVRNRNFMESDIIYLGGEK